MKRFLALFLSILLMTSMVVCVDVPALTSSQGEFEINRYIADYLADVYIGENVSLGEKSIMRNYLEYYSKPANASPAQVLLK